MAMRAWMAAAGAATLAACAMTPKAPERSDIVAEPSRCTAQRFEIYFPEGEARLTDAARRTLGMTAAQLQGCMIRKVTVVGLADASGAAVDNQTLSEQRAVAVTQALEAQGWPAPAFEVAAAGDAGSVTAGGAAEPMRRRTEVMVDAVPR